MIGNKERSHEKGIIKKIDEPAAAAPFQKEDKEKERVERNLNLPGPRSTQITGDFNRHFNPESIDVVPGSGEPKVTQNLDPTMPGKTRDQEI